MVLSMNNEADTCELWANKTWTQVDVASVLTKYTGRKLRCRECHGAVRAHSAGKDGMRPHFEHLIGHSGCSLGHYFNGTQTRHHKALS